MYAQARTQSITATITVNITRSSLGKPLGSGVCAPTWLLLYRQGDRSCRGLVCINVRARYFYSFVISTCRCGNSFFIVTPPSPHMGSCRQHVAAYTLQVPVLWHDMGLAAHHHEHCHLRRHHDPPRLVHADWCVIVFRVCCVVCAAFSV